MKGRSGHSYVPIHLFISIRHIRNWTCTLKHFRCAETASQNTEKNDES